MLALGNFVNIGAFKPLILLIVKVKFCPIFYVSLLIYIKVYTGNIRKGLLTVSNFDFGKNRPQTKQSFT
jgi:hypothetical protein